MKKVILLTMVVVIAMITFAVDAGAAQSLLSSLDTTTLGQGLLLANGAAAVDPEIIKAELKRIGDELKAFAESAKVATAANVQLSEETKVKVDELLIAQGEGQARLSAAEQVIAELDRDPGAPARPKSWGELVTESDEFEAVNPNSKGKVSFDIKAAITEGGSLTGDVIQGDRVPGIVVAPNQRLFIRDVLSFGRTTSNSVEYVRETGFTNSADVVSENPAAGKPESDLTFELDSAPVATIAHWVHASKQVLSDIPMLQSYIDVLLRYGLKFKEEAQLLKGSGVGLNINGVHTQAEAYVNPGVTVQDETFIDRIRLALLQAELAEYYADTIVLNPIDWTAVELTKDSQNRYLFSTPQGMATRGLWARPVVPTQSMTVDEFLVGSFQQGAQGWDREDVTITISFEDRDNIIKNMVTILVEERVALTVYRPEAFVEGTFAGIS